LCAGRQEIMLYESKQYRSTSRRLNVSKAPRVLDRSLSTDGSMI
jgi:hypothetical protein